MLASPLKRIGGTGDLSQDAARVLAVAEEEEAAGILVGLPIHMDGNEGEQAKLTRAFASKLAGLTALPVLMWDERLSSKTADEYLAEAQLTRKKAKARRDAVAAQVILQSYLDHDDLDRGKPVL